MKLCKTDPLTDSRWDALVARRAIRCATVSSCAGLPAGSWELVPSRYPLPITATRCFNGVTTVLYLRSGFWEECDRQRWQDVELRPLFRNETTPTALAPSRSYAFHIPDLTPSLGEIFEAFHKSSMQCRIRKPEKEKLSYEVGSRDLLEPFYELLVMTPKRHHLIPQLASGLRTSLIAWATTFKDD